jgi:hypothetical protein
MKKKLHALSTIAIAVSLGFLSPSIKSTQDNTMGLSSIEFSLLNSAEANNININRNKNKNRNTNVNVNRNVNVNVNNNRRSVRPLGVLAGMAIGSIIVASAMSPSCTTVLVNGISYKKCDNTYYQPQGADYIVVTSPY